MPEVIRLSDRILVMRNDAIVGELPKSHQYDQMSESIMARLS
jgi:ABC-type sugar transport system ATPase subunit